MTTSDKEITLEKYEQMFIDHDRLVNELREIGKELEKIAECLKDSPEWTTFDGQDYERHWGHALFSQKSLLVDRITERVKQLQSLYDDFERAERELKQRYSRAITEPPKKSNRFVLH